MENLLSNKWDNAFLNESFHEAILDTRIVNGKIEDRLLIDFARTTGIYLVDNTKLQQLSNTNIFVGDNIILVSKEKLVNSFEGKDTTNIKDVNEAVAQYVAFVVRNAFNNKDITTVTPQKFVDFLNTNDLSHVAVKLGLEKNHISKNQP